MKLYFLHPTLLSCDFLIVNYIVRDSENCIPCVSYCLIPHALTNVGCSNLQSGTELLACLMLMEVSNPFMHGRELLKELKLKDSTLSLANDVCVHSQFAPSACRLCAMPRCPGFHCLAATLGSVIICLDNTFQPYFKKFSNVVCSKNGELSLWALHFFQTTLEKES